MVNRLFLSLLLRPCPNKHFAMANIRTNAWKASSLARSLSWESFDVTSECAMLPYTYREHPAWFYINGRKHITDNSLSSCSLLAFCSPITDLLPRVCSYVYAEACTEYMSLRMPPTRAWLRTSPSSSPRVCFFKTPHRDYHSIDAIDRLEQTALVSKQLIIFLISCYLYTSCENLEDGHFSNSNGMF